MEKNLKKLLRRRGKCPALDKVRCYSIAPQSLDIFRRWIYKLYTWYVASNKFTVVFTIAILSFTLVFELSFSLSQHCLNIRLFDHNFINSRPSRRRPTKKKPTYLLKKFVNIFYVIFCTIEFLTLKTICINCLFT